MREKRLLTVHGWYRVETAVNNDEPLFWVARERARFMRVLDEAHVLYAFVPYGLCFNGPWVSFYIKPANGFMLPVVMQWIKQTFACRCNAKKHLDGHVWGDRYWSKVLEGEPPEEEISPKEAVREESGKEEADGQIPKARPREGPPDGDSHGAREILVYHRFSPVTPSTKPASGGKTPG
jgi:hypothetical protein